MPVQTPKRPSGDDSRASRMPIEEFALREPLGERLILGEVLLSSTEDPDPGGRDQYNGFELSAMRISADRSPEAS